MILKNWSIYEYKEWRLPHICHISYWLEGQIYGHDWIEDGEHFHSEMPVKSISIQHGNVEIEIGSAIYYAQKDDIFWEKMDKDIYWLFEPQAAELHTGLTVFVDNNAYYLLRKLCYKDERNDLIVWTLLVDQPRTPRSLMEMCGKCAVALTMRKQSDYANLCVNGAESVCVKNCGYEKVTFRHDKSFIMLEKEECLELEEC